MITNELAPSRSYSRFLGMFAAVAVALLTGCGDDDNPADPDGGSPPEKLLVASKLAVLAVAVATGPEGRGFFDNFLACPRRGVVNYHNTTAGRRATFSGCDAGDGVTVDGTTEVRWVGPNLSPDRAQVTRLELSGPLTVRAEGGGAADVDAMRVEGIAFRAPTPIDDEPAVNRLLIESLRVTVLGTTVGVDERGKPERVFQPTLDLNTLPNPANSLAALTEADVKRIAYDAAMTFASILVNELLEVQRGPHTHTEPCGTLRVTPDAGRTTTHLEYAWTACRLPGGLVLEGTFTQDVASGTDLRDALAMVVAGQATIGGGVPRTTLTRLEWTISGVRSLPANATIRGTLTAAGGQQRPFAFTVMVDD